LEEKRFKVLGIGNAIVDIIAEVEDSFLDKNSMEKGIMQLIDEEDADKLHKEIIEVKLSSGGSVANTISGLALLKNKVAFIGKTGKDRYGDFFAEELAKLRVEYFRNDLSLSKPTARCIILTTPDAERTMNTCLGISSELNPDDIDIPLVKDSNLLYLEGYLWDQDPAKKAFLKAIDTCRKNGGEVSMSLSDPFCVDRHRKEFMELFNDHLDIVFANQMEILSLFETDDFEKAIKSCQDSGILCIITRSEHGSIILKGASKIEIDAVSPEKVIDTTGAGDLYAAGFLHGYVNGRDLQTCGKLASLIASEAVSHFGARPEKDLEHIIRGLL